MTNPYGIEHQRIRNKMVVALRRTWQGINAGLPLPKPTCPRCGQPMLPYEPLQLGHSTAERKQMGLPGDRLEHGSCNMSAGAHSRTKPQHPPSYTPSQDW